jgi:hypothetical protein
MTTEPAFTITTGRFGGIAYRLLGVAGAIEWMGGPSISAPSIPDGLYHYAADVDGDGEDGACECEVLPQGRCWPGAGMLMGASETVFRSGDVARIEARMREVYVGVAAEVAAATAS